MKNFALITTIADKSADLFSTHEIQKKIKVLKLDYSLNDSEFADKLTQLNPELIYLRDPFNTLNYSLENIQKKVDICKAVNPVFVDKTADLEDLLFEDKWVQYQQFGEFMAETKVFTDPANYKPGNFIYKPRISSRARGINFDKMPESDASYIQQEKLNIKQEFRIFVLFGKILPQIALRSSKTENSKVKQKEIIKIQDVQGLEDFVRKILPLVKFDLVGLDIAVLENSEFRLIEVNRSPQFLAYHRDSRVNLAEHLLENYTSHNPAHF